jgi:hypothetical protein
VVRVAGVIEEPRAVSALDRARDLADDFGAAALADVRNALDDRHDVTLAALARAMS